jgi:peptide/nickel transport system substrate-binding protein
MKKSASVVVIVTLCFILLPIPHVSAADPRYGGTLRIGTRIPQFNRIDVRYPTTANLVPVYDLIYEGLFDWDQDDFTTLIPRLATGYETDDAKVWTIHLRKGVKFHNGREMTADDMKANLDWRITTPKGWKPIAYQSYLKYLNRVEVVDKYTIKIVLDQPFSSLIRVMTYAFRGVAPPEEVEKYKQQFMLHPSGTGPFKVVEIRQNEKLVLERFEDYWGSSPYLDRVEALFIRSEEARLTALQHGDIDICQVYGNAKPILERDPSLHFEPITATSTLYINCFNMRRWPMNDIRFRKAYWMGADWENITLNADPLKSEQHPRTFLDRSKYFNPEAVQLVSAYNPVEARKLVRETEKDAGKKIPPIYYYVDSTSLSDKAVAESAKFQLEQVGIPINLQHMSHVIWLDGIVSDPKMEWDSAAIGLDFAQDPGLGFIAFFTDSGIAPDRKSLGGYSNPEFDQWVMKAESTLDERDQINAYQEAEKILLQDAAAIPLYFVRVLIAWDNKVKGLVNHPLAAINVINGYTNVWLEE